MVTIICIAVVLTVFLSIALVSNYKARTHIEQGDHIELRLKGIDINWLYTILLFGYGLGFIALYTSKGHDNIQPIQYYGLFFCIFIVLVEGFRFLFTYLIGPDRIILTPRKIMWLGERKISIPLQSLSDISLNGLTNKVKFKGAQLFKFSRGRLHPEQWNKLSEFIEQEIGIDNLSISDNARELITYKKTTGKHAD